MPKVGRRRIIISLGRDSTQQQTYGIQELLRRNVIINISQEEAEWVWQFVNVVNGYLNCFRNVL